MCALVERKPGVVTGTRLTRQLPPAQLQSACRAEKSPVNRPRKRALAYCWAMSDSAISTGATTLSGPTVVASLVVASNGATSLNGGSRSLRTAEDRERFLALRNGADISAILVGGATAAAEPYQSAPHPLIVFSRSQSSATFPGASVVSGSLSSIAEFIAELKRDFAKTILCEGGVELLHLLLEDDLIDICYISRVAAVGDGHFLNDELLRSVMALTSTETINQTTFEKYERASR